MIFIVDDDKEFAEVLKSMILDQDVKCFTNAIAAINATTEAVPELIFLDILLDGPDGFTFLNELQSYEDLAKVPVVVMSSLNLDEKFAGEGRNVMRQYGIVGWLNKSTMVPEQIKWYVDEYAK